MANATMHSAQAHDNLQAALLLLDTNPSGAGELAYGALIQASMACAHQKGDQRHSHSRKAVIQVIRTARLNRDAIDMMLDTVEVAFAQLHGGFYNPADVDVVRLNHRINRTRRAAILLLTEANL